MGKKHIIITGASKGIGRAIAEKLAAEGHNLFLFARSENRLKDLCAELSAKHEGKYIYYAGDITEEKTVEYAVEDAWKRLGSVDCLINNAGIGVFGRVDKISPEDFRRVWEVNVWGSYLFTRFLVPEMIGRRKGQIINISSVAGLNGFKGGTAYAASKFGLNGFTESLREDVKEFGIAVTAVCPGSVHTEFGGSDLAGKGNRDYLLTPEDVAHTIAYLVAQSETANTKLLELKPRRGEEHRP